MVRHLLNICIGRQSRSVVISALVPLIIWSGVPLWGCICADGHYEPFCRGFLCAASQQSVRGANGEAAAPWCGCACCKAGAANRSASCCLGKRDCCRQRAGGDLRGEGRSCVGNSCCTPVVRSQAVAVVFKSPEFPGDHHSPAFLAAALEPASVPTSASAGSRVDLAAGLPPDDLVKLLGRLLI